MGGNLGAARGVILAIVALGWVGLEANAQTYVDKLSCTEGPYRVQLPKSYKAVRGLGHLRRERVLRTEDQGTHTVTHRELRFNGLELVLVTSSDKPNQYVLSKAILSSRAWRIGGQLRVGSPARAALKGLQAKDLPKDGELEFSGDKDSIRINLAAGRVLDVEYSCSTG
jgi:hypothetical protein